MPDDNEIMRQEEEPDKFQGMDNRPMTATEARILRQKLEEVDPLDIDAMKSLGDSLMAAAVDCGMFKPEVADRLHNWFTYHAPKGNQTERYERVRDAGKDFAIVVTMTCPESPERDHAVQLIRQAVYNANAAIACNE